MTSFLLIAQIVIVVVLTIAVLLQKSSSIGLGAYSGSNESVFGAKGPGSFLAKATFFIGFLLVSNTIALGYFYGQENNKSVVDSMVVTPEAAAPSAIPAVTPPATTADSVTTQAPVAAQETVTTEAPVATSEAEAAPTAAATQTSATPTPVTETNSSH
jgi:preprotein translocase subunit SecG